MICKFCDKEVKQTGEPKPIYTGDLYQSYHHIDGSCESGENRIKHHGYASKIIKKK